MKIHRILADSCVGILRDVFRNGRVLDHELAAVFSSNRKWGKRDRAFVAETVFEVTRWRRVLGFLADCDEITALCAAQWLRTGYDVPDWWESGALPADEVVTRESEVSRLPFAVRESIPEWLDETGRSELGDRWEAEIEALNRRAPVYLRVNRLRCSTEEARDWLVSEGVEVAPVEGVPDALVLPPGRFLPKALRTDGRIEIQDAGSQLIIPMLEPRPGERVIDACCGAGGKALQTAAWMENQGTLYALDTASRKLDELRRRARQARATCIRTAPILDDTVAGFTEVADRLLLDVPCSGLGTLRRQPDLKWRLKPSSLDRVRSVQRRILDEYPAMLKPGGRLVYATCSILPSENEDAVRKRVDEGGFTLVDERRISPNAVGFDGFYAAALVKDP